MEDYSSTPKKIKFVCISDTHSKIMNLILPKADVLIHAGDFSMGGKKSEIEKFTEFLDSCNFITHKIIIAGNHDYSFDEEYCKRCSIKMNSDEYPTPDEAKKMLSKYIYLENSSIELYGYKIWGSPVTPDFFSSAFQVQKSKIHEVWDQIPDDTDILITHGPPNMILDKTPYGENVGCEELLQQIKDRISPKVHVFGHIHSSYGMIMLQINKKNPNPTTFINASICNASYKPRNAYHVFELDDLNNAIYNA